MLQWKNLTMINFDFKDVSYPCLNGDPPSIQFFNSIIYFSKVQLYIKGILKGTPATVRLASLTIGIKMLN